METISEINGVKIAKILKVKITDSGLTDLQCKDKDGSLLAVFNYASDEAAVNAGKEKFGVEFDKGGIATIK